MPVNLYYTQKVRGFQQEKVKYSKESVKIRPMDLVLDLSHGQLFF